jgi:hypothetical protein
MAIRKLHHFAQLQNLWLRYPAYLDNRLPLEVMSDWPHIRSLVYPGWGWLWASLVI